MTPAILPPPTGGDHYGPQFTWATNATAVSPNIMWQGTTSGATYANAATLSR